MCTIRENPFGTGKKPHNNVSPPGVPSSSLTISSNGRNWRKRIGPGIGWKKKGTAAVAELEKKHPLLEKRNIGGQGGGYWLGSKTNFDLTSEKALL